MALIFVIEFFASVAAFPASTHSVKLNGEPRICKVLLALVFVLRHRCIAVEELS
jgi:hypothetical protein